MREADNVVSIGRSSKSQFEVSQSQALGGRAAKGGEGEQQLRQGCGAKRAGR